MVSDFEIKNNKLMPCLNGFPNIFLFGMKLIRNQILEKITFRIDTDSLLILEEMVVLALSQALAPPGLPTSTAGVAARSPG